MPKIISATLLAFFAILSCKNKEAQIPSYVTVSAFDIKTDFDTEGTASSRFTTFWAVLDGKDIGAFEMPTTFPVIADGTHTLQIIPGINLNGITAVRNQYEFIEPFTITQNFIPGQQYVLQSANWANPRTAYRLNTQIVRLEDFESTGVSFESTVKSDTNIIVTSQVGEVFIDPKIIETNTQSGKIVLPKGPSRAEFKSINSFTLPKFSENVYLEVNYKCEVPITFGVFANEPQQSIQAPVVTVLPTNEWKKIYINLVSEVSGYPNALDYHIFFGSINGDVAKEKTFFVDNLKLVYR